MRISGRGAGAYLRGGLLDRAHQGAARARAREPARAAAREPAARARRRLCRAGEGGALRCDPHRRRGAARAGGPFTPALARRQNDLAAARAERRRAAAGAGRAQRPRFHRIRARCGALRAAGGGQGMNGVPLALVLAASFGLASCAAHKPAPVADRSARGASQASRPGAHAPEPATQPAAEGFYAVRRGDTLYSIALEHGADYRELAQWNSLDDPAKIRVGQLLRVRPPEDRAVELGRPRILGRVEPRPLDPAPPAGAHPAPVASGTKI